MQRCSVLQRYGLIDLLLRLVEIDEFMAELWKVHLAVKKQGYVQVGFIS